MTLQVVNMWITFMNYKPDNYSIYQLLEIFPEARSIVRTRAKEEITQLRKQLDERLNIRRECTKVISKVYKDRWFWQMVVDFIYIPDKQELEKKLKQRYFLLEFLKPKPAQTVKGDKITQQDIMRAKEVPVVNFIEVNRMGFARCPLHTDKTPSLKYYPKTNTFYCYSCGACRDTIDLIMKLQNKDFHQAVKFLINK